MNEKFLRQCRLFFCFSISVLISILVISCDDGLNFLPKLNEAPIADFDSEKKEEGTLTWLFYAEKSYDPDGAIVSYKWDFGDGSTAEGKETFHLYKEARTYIVTLIVKDDDDAQSTGRKEVDIYASNISPVAWLEIEPEEVKTNVQIGINGGNSYDQDGFITKYAFWIIRHEDDFEIRRWKPQHQSFQYFTFKDKDLFPGRNHTKFRIYLEVWDDNDESCRIHHIIKVFRE